MGVAAKCMALNACSPLKSPVLTLPLKSGKNQGDFLYEQSNIGLCYIAYLETVCLSLIMLSSKLNQIVFKQLTQTML